MLLCRNASRRWRVSGTCWRKMATKNRKIPWVGGALPRDWDPCARDRDPGLRRSKGGGSRMENTAPAPWLLAARTSPRRRTTRRSSRQTFSWRFPSLRRARVCRTLRGCSGRGSSSVQPPSPRPRSRSTASAPRGCPESPGWGRYWSRPPSSPTRKRVRGTSCSRWRLRTSSERRSAAPRRTFSARSLTTSTTSRPWPRRRA
mmetsp:Transcript_28147/g.71249  ORF Transcript_28147/g.71249 Transcript_28147/m.71249 type:complete len:202 (+) Transcript_28147:202-807(+)